MNTRLLRRVASDILEHPENFDMGVVNCGTVCCIAGRASILAGNTSYMVGDGARDMLAALKAIAPMFDNDSPLLSVYAKEIKAAQAAIAKAEAQ